MEAARYCLVFAGHDEVIRLNTAGQLGLGERCLLPVWDSEGLQLRVEVCPLGSVSGPWSYSEEDLTVRCRVGKEELCVEMRGPGGLLTLAQCHQVNITLNVTTIDLLTLLFYKGGEKTEMAVAGVQTTLDIILVYREGGKIKSVIFIFDTLPRIVVNNMLFVFFINL